MARFLFTAALVAASAAPAWAQFAILKDVNVGAAYSDPTNMTHFGGILYFAADDGVVGRELWVSNGLPENTELLIDIRPGAAGSNPDQLTVASFRDMYFSANDGTNGVELWVTDGSDVGTLMAADINPAGSSNPNHLTAGPTGTVFFAANDGTTGTELWKYSTLGGAERLTDLVAGAGSSDPHNLFYHAGILYFAATNGTTGVELYKYDGVSVSLLSDLNGGPASSDPGGFAVVGGYVYFAATAAATGRELYKTDGSMVMLVRDINSGMVSSNPKELVNYNGVLVFAAESGNSGIELWRSDGTPAGTVMIDDYLTGANKSSDPTNLIVYNNLVVFAAAKATPNAKELSAYNGTSIFELKKIESGNVGSYPADFTIVNGILVFSADDNKFFGRELWRTEGTPETTFMIQDINPGAADANPDHLIAINNKLFFTAIDSRGDEPWHQGDGIVLAVEMSELYASAAGGQASVNWSTAAELGNVGFHVYRVAEGGVRGERLTAEIIPAAGNETAGAEYSFADPDPLSPGESRAYFVVDVDFEGVETDHPVILVGSSFVTVNSSVNDWQSFLY